MAVQGALWLAKHLSLSLNFSFLNRISLLLITSSYPIVLTRLGGPRSTPYTSRKNSRVWPGIEPGTSWMAVRRANHYTKQVAVRSFTYALYKIVLYCLLHLLLQPRAQIFESYSKYKLPQTIRQWFGNRQTWLSVKVGYKNTIPVKLFQ